eukprot:3737967-Amphidinium_carterae.1
MGLQSLALAVLLRREMLGRRGWMPPRRSLDVGWHFVIPDAAVFDAERNADDEPNAAHAMSICHYGHSLGALVSPFPCLAVKESHNVTVVHTCTLEAIAVWYLHMEREKTDNMQLAIQTAQVRCSKPMNFRSLKLEVFKNPGCDQLGFPRFLFMPHHVEVYETASM